MKYVNTVHCLNDKWGWLLSGAINKHTEFIIGKIASLNSSNGRITRGQGPGEQNWNCSLSGRDLSITETLANCVRL